MQTAWVSDFRVLKGGASGVDHSEYLQENSCLLIDSLAETACTA